MAVLEDPTDQEDDAWEKASAERAKVARDVMLKHRAVLLPTGAPWQGPINSARDALQISA